MPVGLALLGLPGWSGPLAAAELPAASRPAAAPRPAAPRPELARPAMPRPAAPATGEDPVAAAAGDPLLPPILRDLRDQQPPNPGQVARDAGLRPRRGQPTDLRARGTQPSAAEFSDLLAP